MKEGIRKETSGTKQFGQEYVHEKKKKKQKKVQHVKWEMSMCLCELFEIKLPFRLRNKKQSLLEMFGKNIYKQNKKSKEKINMSKIIEDDD